MWNTVSARIRGAATELVDMGEETDEYVESTSKLRDLVKGYTGFDIMDDEENFKDLYEIVLGIGQAWGDLEDIQKAALGEALGGKRNARGLYSIFDHLDTLTSAYESSVNSAGSAMKEQEHYAESVQYSIDRTKASLQELAHDFLSSDLLKGLIEGANTFLQIVDKIISSLGTVGTLLTGGGIASFVHGMATNKGLMAGLFENLASRNGDVAGSSMLSNILKTFTGGTAENTVQKAGEGIARNIGEGIERRGSYHIGDAVTNALAAGFTREVIPYGDGDFVEVWKNKAGEIVQETQGATRALDASLVESATQSGTTAGTGFASAFASAVTAHPLIASAIGIAVAAGLTAAIVAGVNNYQKHQRARNATKALETWNDTQENTQNYQQRYKELKEGLNNATTEADQVSYREQILALQQEIIGQYGSEASAVDLVNGKLEEQLGVIADISDKQMQKNMRDPDFVHAIHDAEETFNKVGDFQLGTTVFDGSNKDFEKDLTKVVNDLSKKYTKDGVEVGFELEADGVDGTKSINIKNATKVQAKQIMDEYKAQLENLSEKYINDDAVQLELGGLIDRGSLGSGQIQKDVDEYWELYIYSLQRKLTQPQKDLVDSYKQSMSDLTTAMSSGEGFDEAYDNFANLNQRITDELDGQFDPYIKNIKDSYSGISEDALALRDVLDNDSVSKNNPLKDKADDLKNTAEELKDLNIKPIDIEEIMNDPEKSTNKAKEAVMALTKAYGILGEDITADKNALPGFIDLLTELGIATEASADKAADGSQTFKSFRSSIINDIANIDTLNAAIAESFSGKGLSYSIDENGEVVGAVSEIKKAYGELMQEAKVDESSLFQSTALGLKTNQSALRALQSELEAKNKIELNNQLEEAQKNVDDLQSRFGKMDKEAFPERYDKLKGELDAAKSNLESVRELQAAYEGATSAYQKWVNAQSMGEEGDVYNAIRETAFKRGDELLEQGLVGTNEFRAIAQMFSDEDLSTAGIEKIISEYQAGSAAVKSFFTEGYDGLAKFGEDAASKGIEGIKEVRDEAGNLGYAFENVDVQQIADAYGVSASVIESIFGRMADYGIEVQRYSGEASEDIQKLNQQATEAQKTLKDHVTEFKTATEETNAEMQKLQEGGNVDLFNRPQISTQKLVEAGWDQEDVGEGTATVYSSTYSNEDGTVAMNFTPILPDGSVMEPGEFANYCEEVVAGVRQDDLQLQIGGVFEGENAVSDADAAAKRIHELQAEYYGLDGTTIDLDFNVEDLDTVPELESKIKELEDYQATLEVDSSEYKAAGDLLDQLKQKKDAVEQATNIPVTYTDLENANTAMSQLQTRISEIQSYNATVDVGVDVQNDEQVQQLANEIAALPKEAQVKVGISEENAGNAQAIVQQIQDNPASIKVTPELVKNDLDQEGTIKYSAEITKPIPESELNKKGTITYNSKIGKALNSRQLHKSETINQTTNVTKNETTNKTVNTTVTGNATQAVSQIKNALAGLQSKNITVGVTDNATVKINKIKAAESKLQDKSFDITANDHASAVINKVAAMTIPSKSVTITSNASAVAIGISNLARQINSLQNKTITITKKTVNVGPYNGTANAFGTAHATGTVPSYFRQKRIGSVGNSMINHYNGNAHSKGSWGLKRDEPNALINELGPEIVVLCKICYHVWRHACKITSNC